jgi:anoctamin-10
MVTQFGYITIWSVTWPLSPLFALINNWFELRTDAAKIATQVRRPIAERVESIGPWLQTMVSNTTGTTFRLCLDAHQACPNSQQFVTWLSFVTSSTLCYLFRPNLDLPVADQSINPHANFTTSFSTVGSGFLHSAIENSLWAKTNVTSPAGAAFLPRWMAESRAVRTVLPTAIPALMIALLASHAFFIVRLAARQIAEKLVWEPSPEAKALEMSEEAVKRNFLQGRFDDGLQALGGTIDSQLDPNSAMGMAHRNFWRGTEEGTAAIATALKRE